MPRRSSQPFGCPALADLARQLAFAPPERRLDQIRRAERLHDQIEPDVEYPAEFVIYRITHYRSETRPTDLLRGEAVARDLRLLIDRLSWSMGVPDDPSDPADGAETVARRLGVSSKTLFRWRELGLRWRWGLAPGTREKRVVYPRRALEWFAARRPHLVQRAREFSRMDAPTRQKLLRRARRLAQARNLSLHRVARHLARRTGRGVESIRLLLQKHDRTHPRDPIFSDRGGPLSAAQKREIAAAHRSGMRTPELCRRFRRTRTTIHRAILEDRAAEVARQPLRFSRLPTFQRDDADEVYLAPRAEERGPAPVAPAPHAPLLDDLPEALRPLYGPVPLPAERLHGLLVRLNYARYRAADLRSRISRLRLRAADLDRVEGLLRRAADLRRQIVGAAMPLVLSVCRRHLVGQPDASPSRLLELLTVGNHVLYEAVDGFDIGSSGTFEAYLTWALMRRFAVPEATGPGAAARAHRRLDVQQACEAILADARAAGVAPPAAPPSA